MACSGCSGVGVHRSTKIDFGIGQHLLELAIYFHRRAQVDVVRFFDIPATPCNTPLTGSRTASQTATIRACSTPW